MQDKAEQSGGNDVRISVGGALAIECSVNDVIKILLGFVKAPEKIGQETISEVAKVQPIRAVETTETPPPALTGPPATNVDQPEEERRNNWSKRFIALSAFVALALLFLYAGGGYLENYKSQASAAANHELKAISSKAYDKILAEHTDELLENLKELTAITKKASTDSLYNAAISHRGRNPAGIAKEALLFIGITKQRFDEWTARPNDWPKKQKPTKEDITDFLHIWKEKTEPLLDRLQEAQNSPLDFLIEKAQLPMSK
jgi:hypothetical protein